jgi:hypothetical protein
MINVLKNARIVAATALTAVIALFLLATLQSSDAIVNVDFEFEDNFDSYATGSALPLPWRNIAGLSSSAIQVLSTDYTVISPPNHVQLSGNTQFLLGSVIYHPIELSTFTEVEFWVGNSFPGLPAPGQCVTHPDCHYNYGGAEFSVHPDWRNLDADDEREPNHRGLIEFTHDGLIIGGEFELEEQGQGLELGPYNQGQWYHVRIVYERVDAATVKLSYYVYDTLLGEQTFPALEYENDLAYVGFWAGSGEAWYDDVRVTSSGEPPPTPVPTPTPTPLCWPNADGCAFLPYSTKN